MAKPAKRRTRTKKPRHDLYWLMRLLHDVYGMRVTFMTEEGSWHTDEPVIADETPGHEGFWLEDGRRVVIMHDLTPMLAGLRLPDVPDGFDELVAVDPDSRRWTSLLGLMRLVRASTEPEIQEVWASWVQEHGDNLDVS